MGKQTETVYKRNLDDTFTKETTVYNGDTHTVISKRTEGIVKPNWVVCSEEEYARHVSKKKAAYDAVIQSDQAELGKVRKECVKALKKLGLTTKQATVIVNGRVT